MARNCLSELLLSGFQSPAETQKLLEPMQWAAVNTHSSEMSMPPQNGIRPCRDVKPTCHFHLHCGASSPLTMEMLVSLSAVAASGPKEPQVFCSRDLIRALSEAAKKQEAAMIARITTERFRR